MIPKQDRQGVRKASDIEQKYNLNQNIDEVLKVATNANKTAANALSSANNAASVATSAKATADGTAEQLNAVSESVNTNTENISALDERIETLENAEDVPGEDGATFTPSVDNEGNLSWTNDKGLTNPPTVNIKGSPGNPGYTPVKGVDYFDGTNGTSCTHSWNGTTLTVTSASGTSSANLKGEKGDPGTGTPGANATINGVTTLNIVGGDNVTVTQSGSTLTISASGGSSVEVLTTAEIRAICK